MSSEERDDVAAFGGRDLVNSDEFPYTSPVGSFPAGASPHAAMQALLSAAPFGSSI